MHIVKVQRTRAVWLFDTEELNPRGRSIIPDLFDQLIKRYRFRQYPKVDELSGNTKFREGRFILRDRSPIEVALEMYGDGLIVETRHSTHACDEFLGELVLWISMAHGIQREISPRRRSYISELIVEANFDISKALEPLRSFTDEISKIVGVEQVPTGMYWGIESRLVMFSIERRVDEPFAANRYFSTAALPTDQHIAALDAFERMYGQLVEAS